MPDQSEQPHQHGHSTEHGPDDTAALNAPNRRRGRRTKVRWAIVVLLFLGMSVNYLDRANLSVALPYIESDFGISPALEGVLFGSFFWTYALFQLPSGHFVDRFGSRIMYTFAAVWWSIFTGLTAAAMGLVSLFGFRMGLGVGESASYPAAAKAVSAWFPRRERAVANGIYDSGARFGSAVALPIVGVVIAALGWRWSFIITASIGLAWAAAWFFYYREPRDHKAASTEEINYIETQGARTAQENDNVAKVPWRTLFRYRTVWGMMIGFFSLNFVIYFFITWFPSYLVNARHFDILTTGFFGMIPGLVAVLGEWFGGWFSDWIYRRTNDLNKSRKICLVTGMLVSSVIALAVLVPTAAEALVLLSISYASLCFAAASVWSLPADVSPTRSEVASIGGIQNFASNLAGVASPFVVGALYQETGTFVLPLVIIGTIGLLGALSYGLLIKKVKPLPPLAPANAAGTV